MLFPKAAISRAVEAVIPDGMAATDETLEAINKACAEFVSLVSTEASTEARDADKASTMSTQDVVDAIKRLGLEGYLAGAEEQAVSDTNLIQEKRKKKRKRKLSKEEEAAAANRQRELLEATAKRFYEDQGL
eukprot:g6223.t1